MKTHRQVDKSRETATLHAVPDGGGARKGEGSPDSGDSQALLHELRSHQFELEMQNEELRRSQQALIEMRQRYVHLFDFAPVGYVTLDRKGLIHSINLTGSRMLGVERLRLVKTPFSVFVAGEDANTLFNHLREVLSGHEIRTCQLRLLRKDKTLMYAELRSMVSRVLDGKEARCLVSFTDITGRKRAEEALQESEERCRMVLEDQTEIITRYKPDGTYTFVNDACCRFFGKRREELLGKSWSPDAYPDDIPLIREKLAQLRPDHPVVVVENRVYNRSGEVRWMQFVNRGIFNKTGRLVETQAVGRDITGRREAEEAARMYARELEEANSALKVVLRQREQDRKELEDRVLANVRQLVLPYLGMLKKSMGKTRQDAVHLDILEENLQGIVSSFTVSLRHKLGVLTPKEILVADLVKVGRTDKEIGETLHLSVETVKAHRRNIRRKLGLTGGKTNLRMFLSDINK